MGNCSSAPRLKVNLRAFIAANPPNDGYGDGWYFDTMNVLLDRWAYSHVQFLRKKFLEATGDKSEKELDKKGFFKLFAELQDMPKAVAESAFRMFDTDNSGKLNFREFCCALALCCHLMSSDDEKIRFVFDMFDTNDDGLLSSADAQLLLESALSKDSDKDAPAETSPEGGSARRHQRISEFKQELLGNSQHVTFERFYEWASRNLDSLNNLLHTFQIVPSPERERAICEEILSRHQTLQEGSTWYCISHKWLQVWKAHACWQGPAPGRRMHGSSTSVNAGLLSVSRETSLEARDDDLISEEPMIQALNEMGSMGNVHHMSTRPPEIDNSDLEGEHKGELKMNLVEHLDYELIPEEMWLKLVEWYGGGPAIPRKVICMGQDNQPQVELYPPLLLVVVAGESGQPLPQFSRRFFISRQSSLEEVLHMLAERLSRPAERSRLWHRAKGEQWRPVQRGLTTPLEEFLEGKVWDAGAFMLETQTQSGEWPRDSIEADTALTDRDLQRHFEVGDRVEAQSGVTGQWMRGTIVDAIQRDHSSAPSQVKVHYDSTVYKCDEWISTISNRLAPLDTYTSPNSAGGESSTPPMRGATGLQNLGNTCFLNATIQCMANTPLLREYFLSTQYAKDINDKTGGCKGRLAEEFGHIVGDIWSGKDATLTPRNLKRTIDQFAPQFAGYEQHDAQELLAFFLDGLHEDLNRWVETAGGGASSGSGGRGSKGREAGTPKLFSSAKNARPGSIGRSGSRDISPKRPTKSAWRDRSAEPTPLPLPTSQQQQQQQQQQLRAEHTTPPPSSETTSVSTLGVGPSPFASSHSATSPGAVDLALGSSLMPADQATMSGSGGFRVSTSEAGLPEVTPIVEERVDTIPGFPSSDTNEHSLPGDEAQRADDRVVHPTVLWQSMGPRPRIGQQLPGSPVGEDEASSLAPGGVVQAASSWPVVQSTLPGEQPAAGVGAHAGAPVPQLPQGGNFEGPPNLSAQQPPQPLPQQQPPEPFAEPGPTVGSSIPSLPPTPPSVVEPSAPSASAAASAPPRPDSTQSRREVDVKRPGTSRWWNFAWRRGTGALDLPKELSNKEAPHEAVRESSSAPRVVDGATGASVPVGAATTVGTSPAPNAVPAAGVSVAAARQVSRGPPPPSDADVADDGASGVGATGVSASGNAGAGPAQAPPNSGFTAPGGVRVEGFDDRGGEDGTSVVSNVGGLDDTEAVDSSAHDDDTPVTVLGDAATEGVRDAASLTSGPAPTMGIQPSTGEVGDHPKESTSLLEESRPKLPAGSAGAAVAAAAANRVSEVREGGEGGHENGTYNETEDFVPELLTPARPGYKRSLSLFNLIGRRSVGAPQSLGSPRRRPRTPPAMTPLREEGRSTYVSAATLKGGSSSAPCSDTEGAPVPSQAPLVAEPSPNASGGGNDPALDAGNPPVVPASTSTARSFLPWRGKRPSSDAAAGSRRDGSREPDDEAVDTARGGQGGAGTTQQPERATSRDGRIGRAKEKESAWPSFLRRSKSREGSSARRSRPSGGGRPPPTPHKGDLPIVDCVSAEPDQINGDTEAPEAVSSAREDWGGPQLPREPSQSRPKPPADVGEPEERPQNKAASSLGFPFLRSWKRNNEQHRGVSPLKLSATAPASSAASNTTQHASSTVVGVGGTSDAPRAVKQEAEDNTQGARLLEDTADGGDSSDDCEVPKEAPLPREPTAGREPEMEVTEDFVADECTAEINEDDLPDEEKAIRQWERYRARNRSLIVDIFEGQLRSQLTCCHCGASSSTFEPFRYLSVPIPSNHVDRAVLRVVFFPLPFARGNERPQLVRYSVTVPKSATVQKVERALSRLLPVSISSVLLAEVYRSRIHRYLDAGLQLSDVRAEDQLFAFEVLQSPSDLMEYQERHAPSRQRKDKAEDQKKVSQPRVLLIQAMHRRVVDVCRSDGRTWAQRREVFGLPFVMSAASSWTYATLHDMLMLHARRFLRPSRKGNHFGGMYPGGLSSSSSAMGAGSAGMGGSVGGCGGHAPAPDDRVAQMPFVARIVNASGTACGACDRRNCTGCLLPKGNARLRLRAGLLTGSVNFAKIYLALDWVDSMVYDQEYVDSVIDDPSVLKAGAEASDAFHDRDDADDVRSQCTEGVGGSTAVDGASLSRQLSPEPGPDGSVPISACIDAFAQPEEMKKEHGNGIKCEKCGEVADMVKRLEIWREPDVLLLHIKRFHFTGVHFEKLSTPVAVPLRELNLRPWIVGPSGTSTTPYELYAVSCHYGGMSGGHYTSFAVNTEGKEPVWLKFNDEAVTSVAISNESENISRQCYVLFYKKRAFSSSNLINYSALL